MVDVNEHAGSAETTDRGLFDFMKKKKEEDELQKPQEEALAAEFDEKANVSMNEYVQKEEKKEEEKHESLLEKLNRSDSSSCSSSDEEDDEEKKKRKKEKKEKKDLKEELKEKLAGHKDEEDINVPIEECDEKEKIHTEEVVYSEPSHPAPVEDQEKKGFLEKIKEKLPGQQKNNDAAPTAAAQAAAAPEPCAESEKKGFLEKIKDKIPGFQSKNGEEKRDIVEEKKEDH